ncbi:MAG: hypothetical protein ACRD3J_31185 [Thermoanaerobaculia bacterium]
MNQASGTSMNPDAALTSMLMYPAGKWMLAFHGQAFLDHATDSGPRGGEKTFSTNWVMGMASRPLGGGTLAFRSMLSLEPATISQRKYPELFQTGETAFGKQLIDGQHPHDFFMELAVEYLHPVGRGMVYVYAAPVGDPALGPVAFPHRESAMELPQAPIGHHFEDSTHIAYNVITAGGIAGPITLEASAFHGGEPDERRWNLGGGRIDSWAARLRVRPLRNLDFQVSHGWLTKPETIEPGYATRTTASLSYTLDGWSSSVVWGHIYKEVHARELNAWLAESTLRIFSRNHLTIRGESVDKDELFPHPILTVVPHPALPVRVFPVKAYTLGYTFDVLKSSWNTTGIGANATRYAFPSLLRGFYGPHPHSVIVYLRVRLGA